MHQWWRAAGERLRQAAATAASGGRKYHTIQAIPREVTGSRVSARDRAQGRIPAVVFSQNRHQQPPSITKKQLLTTERKQIHSILKSVGAEFFCSTTFKLQIRAGSGSSVLLESGNVLPIKLHRDPETGKVLNMVFVWAENGSELEVDVPVVLKGIDSCPGLKKGGQLSLIRKDLKYLCPAESILQKVEVDISNLDIGGRILMNDIQVDPSLKLLSGNLTKPICKIAASNVESSKPLAA
ncbi:hypothetical protein Cgig2_008043 [Carnegiea gigantea]|uniref:Ribosomal protein L25 beta domain-containing protein n=1 Tax=Carnegiea gigantea TaxID=171969 RepID=A0A9Q1L289_9CARY|nr:hypothetical protein Cgig2_008043 [Carnegiea gigantea]